MKRLFAIPLLALSLTADAFTYLKLGYGVNSIDTDEVSIFSDDMRLKPTDNDGVWQLTAGYEIKPNFIIETSYQRFTSKELQENTLTLPNQATNTLTRDSFQTEMDADRLSIKALFLQGFSKDISLNAGVGFTITQYDFSSQASRETVPLDQQPKPIPGVKVPLAREETKLGATASIGVDYSVWQNFTLGADANISIDSLNTTLQLLGTVGYRF